MVKENSSRKTPVMVTELLKKAVAEKSQSAVARETGLTLLTVQQYLKGIGEPRQKNLERLADYFGVSTWELRGDYLPKDQSAFIKSLKLEQNREQIESLLIGIKSRVMAVIEKKMKHISQEDAISNIDSIFDEVAREELESWKNLFPSQEH